MQSLLKLHASEEHRQRFVQQSAELAALYLEGCNRFLTSGDRCAASRVVLYALESWYANFESRSQQEKR